MRQQLRLRVVLPVAVLGLLGAGFGAFAMGGPAEPESQLIQRSTSSGAIDTGAVDTGAVDTTPTPPPPPPTTTTEAAPPPPAAPPAEPKSPLEQQLAQHKVVVVVFQTPGSDLDAATVRESRAGASDTGAGFLAVDVTKESAVAGLAAEYEVLEAPTVLVLLKSGEVHTRLEGFVDRETVAQAVTNAKR